MELRSGNQISTPSKPANENSQSSCNSGIKRSSTRRKPRESTLSAFSSSSLSPLRSSSSSSSFSSSSSSSSSSMALLERENSTSSQNSSFSLSGNPFKLQSRVATLLQTAKEEGSESQTSGQQTNWLDERSKDCQTSFPGRNFSLDPVDNETQCDLYGKQERVLKVTISRLEEEVVEKKLKLQGLGKLVEDRVLEIQAFKEDYAAMRQQTNDMLRTCASSIAPCLNGITELTNEKDENLANMTSMLEEESMRRRKLHNELQELRGNIRVFCRIRPPGTNNVARAKHTSSNNNNNNNNISLQNWKSMGGTGASGAGAKRSPREMETVLPINRLSDTQISVRTENNNTTASSTTKIMDLDHIFGPQSSQQQVFKEVEPLVVSVMDGYHSCILAYGQTGSGKTYTMEGTVDQPGVNRRTLIELFNIKAQRESTGLVTVNVEVSMVEIYNETVRDLLVPLRKSNNQNGKDPTLLEIRQGPDGVYLPGCQRRSISTLEDVNKILNYGKQNRATSSTGMNAQSSRSHSVVMVYTNVKPTKEGMAQRERMQKELDSMEMDNLSIEGTNNNIPIVIDDRKDGKKNDQHDSGKGGNHKKKAELEKKMELDRCVAKSGRLILVDLAGSERLGKSGAEGKALKEAQNINKSLSALGDVISSLRQRQQQLQQQNSRGATTTSTSGKNGKKKLNDVHIPYRNSKLTYLLQDSLSSDNKALMIIQVSPDQTDGPESLCSLNFASRVACIEFGGLNSSGGGSGTVVKLKNEVRTLREAVDNLKEKYNILQSNHNETSEESALMKERYETTLVDLESLNKQYISLQEELEAKENSISMLSSSGNAKVSELEKEQINLRALLDEKDLANQANLQIISSLKSDIERLKSLLLTQQQEDASRCSQTNDVHPHLTAAAAAAAKESERKLSNLEKEVEGMKKETSQLTEKLLREKEKNMKLLQNLANRAKERPTTNSSTIALMVRREKKEEGENIANKKKESIDFPFRNVNVNVNGDREDVVVDDNDSPEVSQHQHSTNPTSGGCLSSSSSTLPSSNTNNDNSSTTTGTKWGEMSTKVDTSFFGESDDDDDNDENDDLDNLDLPSAVSNKFINSMSKQTQAAIIAKQREATRGDAFQKSPTTTATATGGSSFTTNSSSTTTTITNKNYPKSPNRKERSNALSNLSNVLSSVAQAQEVARSLTPKKRSRESLELSSRCEAQNRRVGYSFSEEENNENILNNSNNNNGYERNTSEEVAQTEIVVDGETNEELHTRKKAKKVTFHIRKSQEHILHQNEEDPTIGMGPAFTISDGCTNNVAQDNNKTNSQINRGGHGWKDSGSTTPIKRKFSASTLSNSTTTFANNTMINKNNNNRTNNSSENNNTSIVGIPSSASAPRFLSSTKSSSAEHQNLPSSGQQAFQMGLASRIESSTPGRMRKPSRVLNQGQSNNLRPGSRASKWR